MDSDRTVRELLIAVAGTVLILWMEAPPWQRKQAMMTAMALASRVAGRPHRAAGRAGMATELKAGREDAAALPYSLARLVGQFRELARRSYEELRSA